MTEQQCLKALCRIQCGAKRSKKCEDCECFDDKVNIWKCVENTQESLVLRQLIREHFELVELLKPHGYGMLSAEEFEHWISYICKHNADNDMIIMSQSEQLEQLEQIKNPQPYKFEELHEGMWVWDDKREFEDFRFIKIEKILSEFDCEHLYHDKNKKVFFDNIVCHAREFEENRFYPVTKALCNGI